MENAVLENVRIPYGRFRNFSGEQRKFNAAGDRNFVIFLDSDNAERLRAAGWNVKYLEGNDEYDDPTPMLKVKVNFNSKYPPKIVLVTRKNKVQLDESSVGLLDAAEISNADMVLHPYEWKNDGGAAGVSAYLKTMYVTIEEDEFASKYGEDSEAADAPW